MRKIIMGALLCMLLVACAPYTTQGTLSSQAGPGWMGGDYGPALAGYTLYSWDGAPGAVVQGATFAAARISEITGRPVRYGGVASRTPQAGEIIMQPGACANPQAAACTYTMHSPVGITRATIVWAEVGITSILTTCIALHELGHVYGLEHYDAVYEGHTQMMHSSLVLGVCDYQAGDVQGLRTMAGA